MTRRIVEVLSLALVWAVLWSDFDAATLVSGVAVCILILWRVPPSTFGRIGRLRPWRTVVFIGSALGRLVAANAQVAKEALTGGRTIQEGVIAVDVGEVSEEIATVIATSFSFSPGTVAVAIRPKVIYVHCLHASDPERLRRDLQNQAETVKALFEEEKAP